MISSATLLSLALVLQGGLPPAKPAPAPAPGQVLAKVNGVEIKTEDVADLLWEAKGTELLDEIIYYQLAKQEAERLKIVMTEQEVEKGVIREIELMSRDLDPGLTLGQIMARNGQTFSRLYLGVKTSILLTKIAFVDFSPVDYFKVSTIIIPSKSNSAVDVGEAIKKCQQAYDVLQKGATWETVVDDYVTDPEGKKSRGLLGWRQIAAFPETIHAELRTLKKNGITKPVQTQFGIQIFRVEAIGTEQKGDDMEQMRFELENPLRVAAVNKIRKTMKVERIYPGKG
jgi:parvulin-like peptidyl-prolyl isomerase